jgi:hypothetical protein
VATETDVHSDDTRPNTKLATSDVHSDGTRPNTELAAENTNGPAYYVPPEPRVYSQKQVERIFRQWRTSFASTSERNKATLPEELVSVIYDARNSRVTPKQLEAATGISVYKIHKIIHHAKTVRKLHERRPMIEERRSKEAAMVRAIEEAAKKLVIEEYLRSQN